MIIVTSIEVYTFMSVLVTVGLGEGGGVGKAKESSVFK